MVKRPITLGWTPASSERLEIYCVGTPTLSRSLPVVGGNFNPQWTTNLAPRKWADQHRRRTRWGGIDNLGGSAALCMHLVVASARRCIVSTMPRALILGGTGMIGRATAARLLAAGWEVDVTGRDPSHVPAAFEGEGATFLTASRDSPSEMAAAIGDGADLLVDCICYTAGDATSLLPLARDATSTVMISSKAVYVDDAGHHSNSSVAPRFAGPILETQPTMAPGDIDYTTRDGYGANKVAAERVLLDSDLPVTVIRPSKIHGAGAQRPREWVFIKRVLDRRSAVLLANRGAGIDHPTAAVNLAALIEVIAANPGPRILNSADPDAPSALEISRAIAGILDHVWEEVLLNGDADVTFGQHPWDVPHPIVLDMTAAIDLGYVPVGSYEKTVTAEVEWLVSLVSEGGPSVELPPGLDDSFFESLFDYAAEDRYLADRH